jgi:hypothetical protein
MQEPQQTYLTAHETRATRAQRCARCLLHLPSGVHVVRFSCRRQNIAQGIGAPCAGLADNSLDSRNVLFSGRDGSAQAIVPVCGRVCTSMDGIGHDGPSCK